MLSHTVVVGHAADTPKILRATGIPAGQALMRVRVAVNRGKDRPADWWSVVGRVPDWLPAAVVRGTVLAIDGRASLEEWIAVDGTARAGLRLDASSVRIVSGGRPKVDVAMPLRSTAPTPAELAEAPLREAAGADVPDMTPWADEGGDDAIPF